MNHNFILFLSFLLLLFYFILKNSVSCTFEEKKKKNCKKKKGFIVQLKSDSQGIISTMLSEGAFIASCVRRGLYFQTTQLKNGNLIRNFFLI
jgi:hypothetical protein